VSYPRPRRVRGPPRLTVAEMVERYAAGAGLEDIAIAADLSSSTVKGRLLQAGVTLRKAGGRPGMCNSYLLGRQRRK
jgi:hypothetical protein